MPVTIDGSNTPTAGGVVYGDGTEYASTAAGTSGQLLQSNGASAPSWVAAPTTSPAGSNTQIQYNNSGAFGASSTLTYDGNVITNTQANGTNSYIRTKSGTVDAYYGAATSGLGTIGVAGTFSNNALALYANSAERFRIGTAGELGIGGATYGTSGQVLTSGGSGAAPTWSTPAGGSWVYLSTVTASGSSTVDVENAFDSTYDMYVIVATGVYFNTATLMGIRFKLGGSYLTSGYSYQSTGYSAGSGAISDSSSSWNKINMTSVSSGIVDYAMSFIVYIPTPWNSGTILKQVYGQLSGPNNSGKTSGVQFSGVNDTVYDPLTGVRFLAANGSSTITGKFRLYGIKNS